MALTGTCQRCEVTITWNGARWESIHGTCCLGGILSHWVDEVDPDDPDSVERFLDNPPLTKP